MKKILLLLLLFIGLKSYSQETLSFEKITIVDSVSKENIYSGLKLWIATAFVSSKAVIEMEDKDAGLIVIAPSQRYSYGKISYTCYGGYLNFTLKFQIKDGKYKMTITNFRHKVNIDNSKMCELGLLTTDIECPAPSYMGSKPYNNKVWIDLKTKATGIYDIYVSDLSKISFNGTKQDDNW